MRFHLFQYTLPADPDLQDLNTYLASHPVATVNQQIVATAGGPLLVFVVETVGTATGSKSRASTPKPSKLLSTLATSSLRALAGPPAPHAASR